MNSKLTHRLIIGVFVGLYFLTSTLSMIHVVEFFDITNSYGMAVFLAVAFEIGAAASMASIIVMDRMKMWIVWTLFILLTIIQINGNVYHAFVNAEDFDAWINLFGLQEESQIFKKRVIAFASGLPLPLIALGFVKALVDYLPNKPQSNIEKDPGSVDTEPDFLEEKEEINKTEEVEKEDFEESQKEESDEYPEDELVEPGEGKQEDEENEGIDSEVKERKTKRTPQHPGKNTKGGGSKTGNQPA